MKKTHQLRTNDTAVEKDYQNLLADIKSLLEKGLHTAYKAVDNIKVQTYWQIGGRIVREELKQEIEQSMGNIWLKIWQTIWGLAEDYYMK